MDIVALANSMPGGAQALKIALRDPRVQQAAVSLGIDLNDPAQLAKLLTHAQAQLPPSGTQVSLTGQPQGQTPSSDNAHVRRALRTYAAVAEMT